MDVVKSLSHEDVGIQWFCLLRTHEEIGKKFTNLMSVGKTCDIGPLYLITRIWSRTN